MGLTNGKDSKVENAEASGDANSLAGTPQRNSWNQQSEDDDGQEDAEEEQEEEQDEEAESESENQSDNQAKVPNSKKSSVGKNKLGVAAVKGAGEESGAESNDPEAKSDEEDKR
mmetsp:Transcript_25452/g.31821  ORF Transcript_25452/g.31821 Transcript_25452/m.31821 type:complete len:114 (+) Transcript_25452:590-931(+)